MEATSLLTLEKSISNNLEIKSLVQTLKEIKIKPIILESKLTRN
jgi:hypothetical protein